MYSDKKKKHTFLIAIAVICVVIAGLAAALAGHFEQDIGEEGAAAIAEAVRRSALQCYVVEGVYPPDLSYLEENYGLKVNIRDYYVTYHAFASNLPPEIVVTRK